MQYKKPSTLIRINKKSVNDTKSCYYRNEIAESSQTQIQAGNAFHQL
ncbi:hypothetical protein PAUR_a3257 [Pseudoalteromonas aurantia 208]|uniref:Orphan protein n=1 Tax=Pseudoalteromonas aurantia 208 TaxID=1314867 RepID=A0ABR9E5K6_9GAMM|nr:hypothetical protein [Pseudoalteromonas aurantia 208]